MCHWTWSSLVQIMARRLFGAESLPEQMMTYCKFNKLRWNLNWNKIVSFERPVRKYRLRNTSHFVVTVDTENVNVSLGGILCDMHSYVCTGLNGCISQRALHVGMRDDKAEGCMQIMGSRENNDLSIIYRSFYIAGVWNMHTGNLIIQGSFCICAQPMRDDVTL